MSHSLEVLIEPLIRHRLKLLYKELANTDAQYSELTREYEQYLQQLREEIPEQLRQALFLYEDTQASLQAIQAKSIYLQGFKDALNLSDELYKYTT